MMQVFHLKQSSFGTRFRIYVFFRLTSSEIITERLEREFDVNLPTTTQVVYKVNLNNGDIVDLQNPSSLPDPTFINLLRNLGLKQP